MSPMAYEQGFIFHLFAIHLSEAELKVCWLFKNIQISTSELWWQMICDNFTKKRQIISSTRFIRIADNYRIPMEWKYGAS